MRLSEIPNTIRSKSAGVDKITFDVLRYGANHRPRRV